MDPNLNGYSPFNQGSGIRYSGTTPGMGVGNQYMDHREMGFRDQVREFLAGAAELSVQFARGFRDIVVQSLWREDSFLVRNFGKNSYVGKGVGFATDRVWRRLKVFNEYLPEDKDPLHAWCVICLVVVLASAAILLGTQSHTAAPMIKKVSMHPPSADRILLPGGRYVAYKEQGVSADTARFSLIAPHTFLSSRLAGIPGLKASVLEEFGIHLLTYDLPGFGESDPHPSRNLESSALDMLFLARAVGVKEKFWVLGYSSGSLHAWAALKHIPDELAGAAMFAPLVNPYDSLMTKEERRGTWSKWTRKRKFLYFLARRFPALLSFFYQRTFLSGKHGQIDVWLSLSLGKRDKALMEDPIYEEFWQRDVEESIRQGNARPFIEEAAMQVSDWGFSLAEINLQKKKPGKGVVSWLKFLLSGAREEFTGFFGPIHIWQGMDDLVVPPSMTDFVHRVLPGAAVHKLPYEGHFTYLYFCDECHRQMFTTLFGTPQGPLKNPMQEDETSCEYTVELQKVDETSSKGSPKQYELSDSTE